VAGQASPDIPDLQERVYLHLNKQVYVAGESIQFKAYVLSGTSPVDIPCSKILYFNLSDIQGKSQANWRINLGSSLESGNLTIPADFGAGLYKLRAYTNYMRNEPANRIFSQDLLIVNLSKATPDTLMIRTDQVSALQQPAENVEKESAVRIRISKDAYSVGEKVQMQLRLEGTQDADTCADLSVSVSLVTPF
jgi:hypothetical protein